MNSLLLAKANSNLLGLFPTKHKAIELHEIESAYKRCALGFTNAKTSKGESLGYLTGILYLAPASISGRNICPSSSAGCRAACLFSAGRGRFYSITRARTIKTLAYHFDTVRYIETIKKSIRTLIVKAKNQGLIPVVRLNGTSDLLFELNSDIIQSFPDTQFYDYTKIAKRFEFNLPRNYHLTFSLSESNETLALSVLKRGGNVAAVFRDADYPAKYLGVTTVNGDSHDLRFLDKQLTSGQGVVIALKAKGKAKKDISGFVKDINNLAKAA